MITFKEDTHEYFNGDRKLISVTQLMRKHGLAPNYDAVPSEILRAKAERGTLIHKEIEDFIKNAEIGFTRELASFAAYIMDDLQPKTIESEIKAYNDVVAGTVDLLINDDGEWIIADIKTTATLHKEAVSWQLSIYAELIHTMRNDITITKGKAFHFGKDGVLNVVEIPLKPIAEVKRLLDCERNGVQYTQELSVTDNQLARLIEVESQIKRIEEQKKAAEAQAQELRAMLMAAMEKNAVTKFENERITLTYIAPTTRASIDSARLKKEMPEIVEKYTKTSPVKASLRITLKEDKNNG